MNRLAFTAHKAGAAGTTGFLGVLLLPIGPSNTMAGLVLLQALLGAFGFAEPVDPDLFNTAFTMLWGALGVGAAALVTTYVVPNKVKAESPAGGQASGGGKTLSSFAGIGLLIAVTLMLAGCAGSPTDTLRDVAEKVDDAQGVQQQIADKLFGEALGPDNRSARLCMIGAGVIEVMTDRVTHFDTDYAATALGQAAAIRAVITNLDASDSNIWFETDVKIVTLELARVLVDAGKDRIPRLLSNLAGSVNILGIASRAQIAARQIALAEGVVLDVKHAIAAIGQTMEAGQVRDACLARIDKNEKRIRAVLGAP